MLNVKEELVVTGVFIEAGWHQTATNVRSKKSFKLGGEPEEKNFSAIYLPQNLGGT